MKHLPTIVAFALLVASCATEESAEDLVTTSEPRSTTSTSIAGHAPDVSEKYAWTTSGPQSGNRVVGGSIDLVGATPIDIALGGTPQWIVGGSTSDGVVWLVAHDDGSLEGWGVGVGGPERLELNIEELPAGTPPVLLVRDDTVEVLVPPAEASARSHPVAVAGGLAYVTATGELAIASDDSVTTLDVGALPDTRLTVSANGLIALLASGTTRYPHGVLGDDVEAAKLVVVDPARAEVVAEADISEPAVIEGIAAPWLDVDGDGEEELLVTVSDSAGGARLVVYDASAQLVAEGPAIGRGNRWRNQLGAAAVGPNGDIEIVDVRVPHIGGVVEFFSVDGAVLERQAEQPGFTSHTIGSRNLDLALIADVTGDGQLNVVVPTQDRTELGILTRIAGGVEVEGTLALPDRLTTNLAAVTHERAVWLAGATEDGTLRIFPAGS